MHALDPSLLSLTAGDLMNPEVRTLPVSMPLREAARELARLGVHGAPVVDEHGRCVGVLSVSDLARWVARPDEPSRPPRACVFQEVLHEPGGQETVLCTLHSGACHLQRFREREDGRIVVACADPHGICTDFQVVREDAIPADDVRHYMTTEVVTAGLATPIAELSRRMLDKAVHRVVVVDSAGKPIGVVSATDVLGAVARAGHREGAGR